MRLLDGGEIAVRPTRLVQVVAVTVLGLTREDLNNQSGTATCATSHTRQNHTLKHRPTIHHEHIYAPCSQPCTQIRYDCVSRRYRVERLTSDGQAREARRRGGKGASGGVSGTGRVERVGGHGWSGWGWAVEGVIG